MTESLPKLLVIMLLAGAVIVFGHYVGYVRGLSIHDGSDVVAPESYLQALADHDSDHHHDHDGDGDTFESLQSEPLPRVLNPALQWRQQAHKQFYRQGLIASMMDPLPLAWQASSSGQGLSGNDGKMKWIAIIIDDVGISWQRSQRAVNLGVPLTISLLPYGRRLQELAEDANARGHDVLVHVPMEPIDPSKKPGRMALRTDIPKDDILARLQWNLGQFGGYVGLNNHMGSFFTADRSAMRLVMRETQRRGLLFLDSVTSNNTIAIDVADRMGVTNLARDVFIDDVADTATVASMLREVERLATKRGWAIAIAHPLPLTLGMLEVWIDEIRGRGYHFITVSQMAMLNNPDEARRDIVLSSPEGGQESRTQISSRQPLPQLRTNQKKPVTVSFSSNNKPQSVKSAKIPSTLLLPLRRPNQSNNLTRDTLTIDTLSIDTLTRDTLSINERKKSASSLRTNTDAKKWPNTLAKAASSDDIFDRYGALAPDSSQKTQAALPKLSFSQDVVAPVPAQPNRSDKIGMLDKSQAQR